LKRKIKKEEINDNIKFYFSNIPINNENEGIWELNYSDIDLGEVLFSVITKTRSNPDSFYTEDRLFSSIKYEFSFNIYFKSDIKYLISQISIIDPDSGKENFKLKEENPKSTLTRNNEGIFEGFNRIQFNKELKQQKQCKNCWEIKIYDPKLDITPIIIIKSSNFSVYARRPKDYVVKRKLNSIDSKLEDLFSSLKKLKNENRDKALIILKEKFINKDL